MDFGKIATKGQKHIPTAAWNAMREVAQEFENGLPGVEQTEIKRNPFLVTIENATGASIEPFAVLEISDAMFPNRTGTDFLNEAINRGVELKGIKPSGDPEKNIAITLDGGPNGTLVQAVVVGAVPCKVMVETSSAENYKYAITVANQTGYLKAAESGNIRILWKETGNGTKEAYVSIDAIGEPKKETFLIKASSNPIAANYVKGNLEYIIWSSDDSAWIPLRSNFDNVDIGKVRLVVCQEDLPSPLTSDYLMPYYPLEDNIGVVPNKSTASGESFTERCGVVPGEHVLSNKRFDYLFKYGRYAYEPKFVFQTNAEAHSGGNTGVYVTINGSQYQVLFPQNGSPYGGSLGIAPDIYAGDTIVVEVETNLRYPNNTLINGLSYPTDLCEGVLMFDVGGWIAECRGWQNVTTDYIPANNPSPNFDESLMFVKHWGHSSTLNSCAAADARQQFQIYDLNLKIYKKVKTNALI